MSINIEKRIRTTITDEWSAWTSTTDPAPYTNTTLVEYRVSTDSTLDMSELTDGALTDNIWQGTGVFDKLMFAVNENIRGEYNQGRLQGTDYATVYLGSMQAVIAQSIAYLQQDKTVADKLLSGEKQREVMDAQKDLYVRQKEAFDDNKYQKLFESQLNYNGMVFQDADAPTVLPIALTTHVHDVFNKIMGNGQSTVLADETTASGVQEATVGVSI